MRTSVKSIALAMALILGVVALPGCSTGGEPGGTDAPAEATLSETFTFAQGADPRGLDPARIDDLESAKPIGNIYEGLTKYAADSTEIEPCLAESWTISDDGLSYTFELREGVTFHDGTDFNAEAVKFNIDRQLPPLVDDDMPYASFTFGTVRQVVVEDEYTVRIDLTQKNTAFLANLAMSMAAPMVSPAALKAGGNSVMDAPVGTGPYRFVEWNKGEDLVLVRNEEYWGEPAKTNNIVFRFITDNSARVLALNNGEVDMIDGIDATVVDTITGAGNELFEAPGMNVNYMAYNTTRSIFADAASRKAFSQAVNVDELVQSLYQGYSETATTILPTFMPGFDSSVEQPGYDPEAAKAGLAAAGITTVHMITYTNPRPYNAATGASLAAAIQGYLQKVGVECTIDTFDWTTYKEKVKAGDYDVAFYGWIGDNGDPDNFLNLLADSDPNLNLARWDDATYQQMIKDALALPNGADRNAAYAACEKYVAERSVWLVISHAKQQAAFRPGVRDFVYHATGNLYLADAVVEQ
ncbi:MAG: ABC transporter substrate-binding protein [Coriobacteriia bacterium]|nr:ABC transporter substrate-binding protein [Coriobacteriia bacterium]MBN2840886.1 ABC transporter substrate-binding protein [Coriobacteriia bacterium]